MTQNKKAQLIQDAIEELGELDFYGRYRPIFGGPHRLDFVNTIVINLPDSCYCNCDYCIDKNLRHSNSVSITKWLDRVKMTLDEFPHVKHITLTGGTLDAHWFNYIVDYIKKNHPLAEITWNTNGVNVTKEHNVTGIKHVNLHRQSVDDKENQAAFKSILPIISLDTAQYLFEGKLTLRSVVDDKFDIDEFKKTGLPLFLNKLLPGTPETDEKFGFIELDVHTHANNNIDRRRRNTYLDGYYLYSRSDYRYRLVEVPIRLGFGDPAPVYDPGREWLYLNVVIVHRSGIVTGTWFEDDKVLIGDENE